MFMPGSCRPEVSGGGPEEALNGESAIPIFILRAPKRVRVNGPPSPLREAEPNENRNVASQGGHHA